MRSIVMMALSAVLAAAPASASAAPMLTIGPMTGETVRKGHPGTIEVVSWQFGAARKGWDGTVKGGSVSERRTGGGESDASAGKGARALAAFTPVSAPVTQGSLRVKVKFPWLDCRVGAAIPTAMLDTPELRYGFADMSVSRCASDEIDLDYKSVVVRGWDPKKKEE